VLVLEKDIPVFCEYPDIHKKSKKINNKILIKYFFDKCTNFIYKKIIF